MSGRRGCDKSTSSLSGWGVYNRANEPLARCSFSQARRSSTACSVMAAAKRAPGANRRPQGGTSETPKPDRSTRHSLSDRVLADTFHFIRQPVALLFLSPSPKAFCLSRSIHGNSPIRRWYLPPAGYSASTNFGLGTGPPSYPAPMQCH